MRIVRKNSSQKEFSKIFKSPLAKNESSWNATFLTSQKLGFGRINTLIPSGNKKSNTLKKQLVKPEGLFKYAYSVVTTGP